MLYECLFMRTNKGNAIHYACLHGFIKIPFQWFVFTEAVKKNSVVEHFFFLELIENNLCLILSGRNKKSEKRK